MTQTDKDVERAREQLESESALLSGEERARVLSGVRIKLTLSAMLVLIVVGLTGMIVWMVTNIFSTLTPSLRQDLSWKAQRGAAELSKTTELGIAGEDRETIAQACRSYAGHDDVLAIVVRAADGRVLYQHGEVAMASNALFTSEAGEVVTSEQHFRSWSPAEIEGMPIGEVALVVSTERLQAGLQLQRDILVAALLGSLLALLMALAFVNLRIGPLMRVTERAFEKLERTTQMALESSRLKSQFLANTSHEIRTPMNGVLGMTRLMMGMQLDSRLRRYVETIDASGRALLTIINDILDFSKIEAGKYKIQSIDFDLHNVTQEVVELLAGRAHDKDLELIYRVAPEVPARVHGDPDRYRQILTNLIGNAVKFTEKGEVFVELSARSGQAGEELVVDVRDTGIGIPESALDSIFESFSQEDGSSVRAYGGTGLGLAISKRLLEMMGGGVLVRSEVDKGSVFTFHLPLGRVGEATLTHTPIEPAGRRALVVDGSDRSRDLIRDYLVAWGMRCDTEAVGLTAVERLATARDADQAYDVVVVAARLQDMGGHALLRAIELNPNAAGSPVVYLSQLGDKATPSELSDAVVAQLNKPIRISDLYDCLVNAFTGRRQPTSVGEQETTQAATSGLKILVVDDNEINQFVAEELVRRLGYESGTAANGLEALEAVKGGGYAAVLMDCQMPVMDGYEATGRIREFEGSERHTPIIALTAHALVGERDKVLEAGMDDYLTKPIRPESLRRALAQLARHDTRTAVSGPPAASALSSETRRSAKVCELFLKLVPDQIEQLRKAAQAGDAAAVRAHAHKLKGSCVSIGAGSMAQVCEALQHAGEQGEISEAGGETERVAVLFEKVKDALELELREQG